MPSLFARKGSLPRALLFSAASNAAVLFILLLGRAIWPEGLPANSHNVFWLATGVNVAGLLILGMGYWPVIVFDAIPAWLFAGESLEITTICSLANAMEALFAAWLIRRVGRFEGKLDQGRTVAALLAAALLAPLANTLLIPICFCLRGLMPWSEYWESLGHWNFANGAGMLLVTPLLLSLRHGEWKWTGRWREATAVASFAIVASVTAFQIVFHSGYLNFAFLAFPAVVYAAVRFGVAEVSAMLGIVLVAALVGIATQGNTMPPDRAVTAVWFTQVFCWILSATGLLIAAMGAARIRAEREAVVERERRLEISLREERAKLEVLRYQLNPHFLFNALNSVYSTLPIVGAEVPRTMLTQLSSYLRSTLAESESHLVPLREELQMIRQYVAIETSRFGDDLVVAISASENSLAWPVPIFILQPLVENAIVHGFSASKGAFRLEIRAEVRDAALHLEVANTGVWRADREERVGLGNTRRRLALLFGSGATLRLDASRGWVRFILAIPSTAAEEPPCAA